MERFSPIQTKGFLNPKRSELDSSSTVPNLQQLQDRVDLFVANKEGEKGSLGELSRVIHWDAARIVVALFDFTTGQQVGLTRSEHQPHGRSGEYWYGSDVVIASPYERQGLAGIGREHKKKFLGAQVPGVVYLLDTIEANAEDAPLVRRILEESGAVKEYWDDKVKGKGAAEVWIERLDYSRSPAPISVRASEIVFVPRDENTVLATGDALEMDDEFILFEGTQVGEIVDHTLRLFSAVGIADADSDQKHWEGVKHLWQAARASGFKARIAA